MFLITYTGAEPWEFVDQHNKGAKFAYQITRREKLKEMFVTIRTGKNLVTDNQMSVMLQYPSYLKMRRDGLILEEPFEESEPEQTKQKTKRGK